ncbi:MAG: reverse transcriptase family protein, partial [Candidatus Thiodiazotropha taylori]|nr:reverse transcriptase family protein [Candidatus Thiodiazotropha taylori]
MERGASPQKEIAKDTTTTITPAQPDCATTQISNSNTISEDLTIVSFNCKNIETALWAFQELSKTTDIFLVQEHWLFDCQLHKLDAICENFNGCGKAVDTGNPILPIQMPRGYGGTAVMWTKDIDHLITKLPDGGNRIQCIEIACKDPVMTASVYMPCKGLKDNTEEFADCLDQLNEIIQKYVSTHKIVIGGDFNEDLSALGDSERKSGLKKLIEEGRLATETTGKTFLNSEGKETSTIDYVFCSQSVLKTGFKVTRLENVTANVSDHLPLQCKIHVNLTRAIQKSGGTSNTQRIKWHKIDKEEYSKKVSEQLPTLDGAIGSFGSLDIKIQKLNGILVKEASDMLPSKAKSKKKPKLVVWNPEIKQAIQEKKKAFWKWKNENRPKATDNELLIAKKITTQNLRRACRMESARQREVKRQEILNAKFEDSGLFHRLIKKQRGRLKQCVNELHVDDNTFHSEAGILEGFRQHFHSLASEREVPGFDKKYGNLVSDEIREIIDLCSSSLNNQTCKLTTDMVRKAITSLNRGKAADFYGVTAEHFLYGGDELLQITTEILNSLYSFGQLTDSMKTGVLTPVFKKKGSVNEAKNYRGITILPTLTKILETVLKETVRPTVEQHQNNLQRGFTPNSSPMNCSLILEEVIRETKDLRKPLYIAFLDVKAAFDVVSHASLLRKLFHIGIDGQEWSLIHSMHA